MARHGYLGDDYGSEYDPNYHADDDRGGSERSWRGGDERSSWGGGDDRQRWGNEGAGGRSFMADDGDRNRSWDRGRGWNEGGSRHGQGNEGGFLSRMGQQASSWFGDDDDDDRGSRSRGSDQNEWFGGRGGSQGQRSQQRGGMSHYGREHGTGGFQGDFGGGRQQGGFGGRGDWSQQGGRQSFSNHPDAHYHSWREKQMQALDRDYRDYCREREQQFHTEFDSWRQNRPGQSGQQMGQQMGGQSGQASGHSNQGQASAAQTGSTGSTGEAGAGGGDELLLSRKAGSMTDAPNEPMSATVSGDGGATMGATPETTRRGR